ncbi:hypothetical protein R6242_21800 [Iodobacter sp. CM08]|uniref:hypothetical protein n=1 Tax=Iodobacter sp. CM08 TaxID=3085902 RepID=UPI0029822338|nr:hypothetical protein [Iodobacter sp. CM08]MDW5419212.1 hypothetical protein [Iodobacter sp. CM08]
MMSENLNEFEGVSSEVTIKSPMDTEENSQDLSLPNIDVEDGSENDQDEGVESSAAANNVIISFLDFAGTPIIDLECRIKVGEKKLQLLTNSNGVLDLGDVKFGDSFEVFVKKYDGSYKSIYEDIYTPGGNEITLVSPKIVFEVETQSHEGIPGDAKENIPKADRNKERTEAKTNKPESIGNDRPVKPQPKIAGSTSKKSSPPLQARDKNGHPQAVVIEKSTDWWGRWRLGMLNWWSSADFQKKGTPQQTVRAVPSASVPDKDVLERLNALIANAEEQTNWEIEIGTVEALARMTKGVFKTKAKTSSKPKGWCAKYVKIALMRTGVVKAGALTFGSASEGYKELLKAGFLDITSTIPDPRWAAPGDIIIYRWDKLAWASRKSSPRWNGSSKKPNESLPNHGHIDIRTYDGYISDFHNYKYPFKSYDLVGVYRGKYFDSMPYVRMLAFLKVLREFECHGQKDDSRRYFMLQSTLNGSQYFSDVSTHPYNNQENKKGSFSGAYQIRYATWKELHEVYKMPLDFSPATQDRMAVCLIENRKALVDVRNGEIKKAVSKLTSEWSSLPGGVDVRKWDGSRKPYTEDDLLVIFEKNLNELMRVK